MSAQDKHQERQKSHQAREQHHDPPLQRVDTADGFDLKEREHVDLVDDAQQHRRQEAAGLHHEIRDCQRHKSDPKRVMHIVRQQRCKHRDRPDRKPVPKLPQCLEYAAMEQKLPEQGRCKDREQQIQHAPVVLRLLCLCDELVFCKLCRP